MPEGVLGAGEGGEGGERGEARGGDIGGCFEIAIGDAGGGGEGVTGGGGEGATGGGGEGATGGGGEGVTGGGGEGATGGGGGEDGGGSGCATGSCFVVITCIKISYTAKPSIKDNPKEDKPPNK